MFSLFPFFASPLFPGTTNSRFIGNNDLSRKWLFPLFPELFPGTVLPFAPLSLKERGQEGTPSLGCRREPHRPRPRAGLAPRRLARLARDRRYLGQPASGLRGRRTRASAPRGPRRAEQAGQRRARAGRGRARRRRAAAPAEGVRTAPPSRRCPHEARRPSHRRRPPTRASWKRAGPAPHRARTRLPLHHTAATGATGATAGAAERERRTYVSRSRCPGSRLPGSSAGRRRLRADRVGTSWADDFTRAR